MNLTKELLLERIKELSTFPTAGINIDDERFISLDTLIIFLVFSGDITLTNSEEVMTNAEKVTDLLGIMKVCGFIDINESQSHPLFRLT